MSNGKPAGAEKKVVAGILGILLGGLGIHKFYSVTPRKVSSN